ncbi:MAG: YihY/virulence factor BrkB family protein [Kiritimatiellae bacterium]|nr:YihY/virulence factor BrkB family protein [Kiritimatiellia bacterium]MDW8458057.1 YhjD/YihY/BrkB family envelope integrity protein [Verrucomicrobiota bacterium]
MNRSPGSSPAFATAVLVVRESLKSFSRNRGLESAATLAFYAFLSLPPLLLLLFILLGRVAGKSETATLVIAEAIKALFPAFDHDILSELAALAQRQAWRLVSIVLLLWSMTPFAGAARHAVVAIFKGEHRPAFFREKAIDLAVVFALLCTFVGLAAGRLLLPALPGGSGFALLRAAVSFAVSAMILALFYRAFAPVRLRAAEALAGACAAALLLAALRPAFAAMLLYNPNYGYAFGSLKAVFLVVVWAYYSFAVLLFGAEVAANTRRRDALLLRGFLGAGGGNAPSPPPRLLERFLRRPEPGTVLFREGEPGHDMYFVRSGAVRLTRGGVELKLVRAGDYFGEMSMLLGAPRSATAEVAEPETELVVIASEHLETILRENPAAVRRLLTDMAVRLQEMNRRVAG